MNFKCRLLVLLSIFSVFSCLSLPAQDSYFANWFTRVKETQAAQPHWLTPMFTTTPRLEEEFRSDIVWTPVAGGDNLNYGAGKGLELIPTKQTEIILGVPPYQVPLKGPDGFGNIPLLLKYRFLTGNEEHGNYIVTAFGEAAFPTDASRPSTVQSRRRLPSAKDFTSSISKARWAGPFPPEAGRNPALPWPSTPHSSTMSYASYGRKWK